MNAQAANSCSNNDSRCHRRYPNGSRCRLALPGAEVRFCHRHDAFAQDRISPRRAAVLTYITSQLLRSLSASGREIHQAEVQAKQKQPIRLIWDIPNIRPKTEEAQS